MRENTELMTLYGRSPQAAALRKSLKEDAANRVFLQGLLASAAPLLFSALRRDLQGVTVFVLQDQEEAAYFYQDMTQMAGKEDILFFPSSFRRAVKYAQRDAANEILRTEVLARLSANDKASLYIVTSPDALAEKVVSKRTAEDCHLRLSTGDVTDVTALMNHLRELGFLETDYVYEPGQMALRGSILDVYSFSSEYPYRIDFFGDEIDTIRTFDIESQLSKKNAGR